MKIPITQGHITSKTVINVPEFRTWLHIEAPICREFGVTIHELHSRSRKPRVAYPRFLAMDLIQRTGGMSATKAAAYYDMDHALAIWAKIRVSEMSETEPEFKAKREAVERAL